MSLKSVVVVLLLAAAIAHAAPTPKFNYETMCNRHQLVLNGNALKSGRELRITQAVEERAGSAFQSEAVNVMQDWETVFEYEIKDKDGKGADGFAFVVQNYDPSALSHGASGMGYAGIPGPAMAIEFDTYKNSGLGDPNDNHVSLHTATAGNTLSASETGFHPQPVQMRLDKGATTVTISYDELAHRVTLQFDNGETFTWDDINLGTLFTGEDDAYVGFTASTGGDEEAHVLHSWRFSAQGNGCSGGFSGASCTIDPSELENECGLYKACTQCSQARSCCGWCSDNDDCRREDDNRGCSLDLKCKKDSNKVLWWGIGIVIAVLVLCGIALFVYWRRTRVSRKGNVQDHSLIAQHDDDSANASTADAQYSQL